MNITAIWIGILLVAAAALVAFASPRVQHGLHTLWARHKTVDPQAGQATSEYVMWAGVLITVIIAISAALQVAGLNIIGRLSDVLGG